MIIMQITCEWTSPLQLKLRNVQYAMSHPPLNACIKCRALCTHCMPMRNNEMTRNKTTCVEIMTVKEIYI